VLDPLNNLNTLCALTLFLDSMDTTAKRLTRVRSYPRRKSRKCRANLWTKKSRRFARTPWWS
jgi:hypothetical protein